MAKEILIDFYDCDVLLLNNLEIIRDITKQIVEKIKSIIVEETWHKFQPIGITYVAIIAKSHIAIHTWPEKKTLALDIFSCDESIPENYIEMIQKTFNAKSYKTQIITREI